MDATELRARIGWGLIAKPGDPLAGSLQRAVGPEEALGQVLRTQSLRRTSAVLHRLLGGHRVPLEDLARYRSLYQPDRVDISRAAQEEHDVVAISAGHPWWPERLDDLQDYAPPTLWVKGSLHESTATQGVALVGSPLPTRTGRLAALALADEALNAGFSIVSGGTRGISTDAHRRSSRRGGIDIAILAGGLDTLYPSDNAALFAKLTRRGALISEAPCTVEPSVERFLLRNRVIAAVADATVIIQADYSSGAISVGYHAAALGRQVAVVPSSWYDTRSSGCWRIYRECGAMVLTEPADLSMVLPGVTHPTKKS
jgi:DNA processing protein